MRASMRAGPDARQRRSSSRVPHFQHGTKGHCLFGARGSDIIPRMRWLKRIGLSVLALLVAAMLTGFIYEVWSRHRVVAEFPPHGLLIDIGGRRIHLDCRGTGTPIVVFESGLDMYGSLSWSAVQDQVARTTRACSYD